MGQIVANVTRTGQVTIPVAIRHHLGLPTPGRVAIAIVNDQVVLRPTPFTVQSVRGIVPALPN